MNQGEFNIPVSEDALAKINQYISWYRNHEEAVSFLFDTEGYPNIFTPERWSFFSDLTRGKVQDAFLDPVPEDKLQLFERKPESENEKEEYLERIYESFSMGDLVALYEFYHEGSSGSSESQEVQKFLARRPKDLIVATDKISSSAFKGLLNNGLMTPVIVSNWRKKKVQTYVTLNFSELDGKRILGTKGLTLFDQEVLNAIMSLYKAGNIFMTINMIYQTMTNIDSCSESMAADISNSITKLMYTSVLIDASEEFASYNQLESAVLDGHILSADRITAVINGQIAQGIIVHAVSLLFRYAEQKGQLIRCEMKLLSTPTNKNEETIVLEGYLRKRISLIRKRGLDSTILFDSVYEQFDLTKFKTAESLRNKKMKIRKDMTEALDYYKQQGFIKDYTIIQRKGISVVT